ncbi:DNA polymerase III subunit alpha [Candidatus Rariloculus sp.]|uniref:DNA polymerase III subunit alpha n=1 Tax=Candidatus Rariloculus sp. TaxID=3101265 RepID=UPI003D14EF3A
MSGYVHLRVHTEYSLVDGIVRVESLADTAAALGLPAVAMTDQSNVSGIVKFCRATMKRGIKPVIGADIRIAASHNDREPTPLTLLCANTAGYGQLSRLLSHGHELGPCHGRTVVLREWLSREALDGLIALSGAQFGEFGRAISGRRPERAAEVLDEWCGLMPGRFYVELQRLGRTGETAYIRRAVALAAAKRVPLLATNEVCFLKPEDFDAHETRVSIGQGRTLEDPDRPRDFSREQYFKSPDEMEALFADLPEALVNTLEVAKRCSFELDLDQVYMPQFELRGTGTADSRLREQAQSGLAERLRSSGVESSLHDAYRDRLASELDVICKMGFEGYFLIVADFIAWAREQRIPVGPGRGSGAGSLVAYALGITDLDPIVHDLLFERFLNPDRVSLPDFDIDFCIEGRDRVIDYVASRYGRDHVSQIVTFGTMAARAVVRDVGRTLGLPYGYVDKIARLIPFKLGIKLDEALDDEEDLREIYSSEPEVRSLIDLARRLEGLPRNVGTHAGGVVIAPAPLTEFMPLYRDADGESLTQLDKDDLEAIGLVKFDFLGLKTLTIIDKTIESINRQRAECGAEPIDISAIGVDDRKTYESLNTLQTRAVFQLESRGMRDLIRRIGPDRFGDLVAIVALFRPGPMHMADDFISRKQGQETIDYLHPDLEPVLRSTYGVILYQEQVMQIARVLAGYSLSGADLLRRAMGKKDAEEMARQRAVFLAGAAKRDVDPGRAEHIFNLMEKFAGYGFNKSHSAAYALIAYQTAWLKAHYPVAFMAAVMTADMDDTDKLVLLKKDCDRLGIGIEPPNVNRSEFGFTVVGENSISYGLGAIKGVGQGLVEAVVAGREHRPFENLLDLCRRVDLNKLNRRALEALVCAGALDELGVNRPTLLAAVGDTLQLAERSAVDDTAGQCALFGTEDAGAALAQVFADVSDWTRRERLAAERENLGLFLTGHPFDEYAEHCRHFSDGPIANVIGDLPPDGQHYPTRQTATLAGVVMDLRRRGNGITMVVDDNTGSVEVTLFDEVRARYQHMISRDAILIVEGQLRYDKFLNAWSVTARSVRAVDEVIEERARRLTILLNSGNGSEEILESLKHVIESFRPGRCEVCVKYRGPSAAVTLTLGQDWTIRPARELRERLSQMLGDNQVSIHYPKHSV